MTSTLPTPVIVSFYCGDRYYYRAAETLREDCARLGLDHDIVEIEKARSDSWLDVCRRKPAFCLEMQRKHRRPIMWIDVDCRFAKYPAFLDGAGCDIAGFLRGWRYLRDFDPATSPRFFSPFALYFNYTPAATSFLELTVRLEQSYRGDASDDFFLHEAWLQHREQLNVLVLSPKLVGREWPLQSDQVIYFGSSGNVKKFIGQSTQHAVPIFEAKRRKSVLVKEAEAALNAENVDEALVLYRRALLADPLDDALVKTVARLERRNVGEMRRVLVFNFFAGVMDRGIPMYAQEIAESMRRIGIEVIELRCPAWLRSAPRPLRNVLFVVFEQLVAPVVRMLRGCAVTVYPYNSAGLVDAVLGKSIVVIHDFIGNGRANGALAARYIRYTQYVHRSLQRTVCAASEHTLRHLRNLPAYQRCTLALWSNPFYGFERIVAQNQAPERRKGSRLRVLLCSGMGANKDFAGALQLFKNSAALADAELRIVGFGDVAHLAQHRVDKLSRAMRERIVVLPRLELRELVAEYMASDFVWVHSRKEGFGRCVLEAKLAGRPVLATNIIAFRQFRGPGVYLYTVERFETVLARLLSSDAVPLFETSSYHSSIEAAVRYIVARFGSGSGATSARRHGIDVLPGK